jgi:L-lactate dehydrogenase
MAENFKIAIIGTGNVGMTSAFSLITQGIATELVLVSRDKTKAESEKLDLEHALPFLAPCDIVATDNYADLRGADLVVFTAGAAQEPGESRLDLAKKNIGIIETLVPQIVANAPDAILLMVTNPVDVLTFRAAKLSGWPPGRVFGSGTMLDTARFRYHLSQVFDVDPRSVHAYILGEHGESSFPVLQNASIGGQPLRRFPQFSEQKVKSAYDLTRTAAARIIEGKGATYYAIATVVAQLADVIRRDQRSVLPVSIPLENYYGVSGVSLSVPGIIGRQGVAQVLETALSPDEQVALAKSAEIVRKFL